MTTSRSNKSKVNAASNNLSKEENDLLFTLLGSRCQSISTSVVQLFFAVKDSNYQTWKKKHFGVACLVKDMTMRSFFIRIFDLSTRQMVWQQEIYRSFEYKKPQPYFHIFEAEDCYAGLNFTDEDEAEEFFAVVHSKIKHDKNNTISSRQINVNVQQNTSAIQKTMAPSSSEKKVMVKSGKIATKKKKISRADIGMPTDFKHLQHAGYDANSGGQINTSNVDDEVENDPNLRQFLIKVRAQLGMNHNELLENQVQRNFVYDFLKTHRDEIDKSMRLEVPQISTPSRALPNIPNPTPPLPRNLSSRSRNELLENQEQRTIMDDIRKTQRDEIDTSMHMKTPQISTSRLPPNYTQATIPHRAPPATKPRERKIEANKPFEKDHVLASNVQRTTTAQQKSGLRPPPHPPVPVPLSLPPLPPPIPAPPPPPVQQEFKPRNATDLIDDGGRRSALLADIQQIKKGGTCLKAVSPDMKKREQQINATAAPGDLASVLAEGFRKIFEYAAPNSDAEVDEDDEDEWSD